MRNVLSCFWNDDEGALITVEWVFFVTILIIGLVAGLKSVQSAVNNELEEVASAIGSLSQSFSFGGTQTCPHTDPLTGQRGFCASTSGSSFTDSTNAFQVDTCVERVDATGAVCPD
jgi:Flp pilus assembly pilin Flp